MPNYKAILENKRNKLLHAVRVKKHQITTKQAGKIKRDGAIAEIILKKKEGKPFRDYINQLLESAKQQLLNNTLRERHDEGFVDGIKSIFIHTKVEQLQDLQSKYQAFNSILQKLENDLRVRDELEKAIEDEKVEVVDVLQEEAVWQRR